MRTTASIQAGSGPLAIGAYSAGSLATGVFSTVPTVLLLYYCTETLKIRPEHAAAIIFIPKVWAVAWDPLVGAWSDGTRTRWGRRLPFLIVGAIGMCLGFIALFSTPPLGYAYTVAWSAAAYFLFATIYSVFAVPYIALPAEISADREQRARFVGWRMVVGMAGVLAGASLAPTLVAHAGGGREGYAAMSVAIAIACLLGMILPMFVTPRDLPAASTRTRVSVPTRLRAAVQARGFPRLALSYFLQITAIGFVTSALPYLVTRMLGQPESAIGVAMAALLGGSIVTPPIWGLLGRRWGERRALNVAIGAFALASIGVGAAVTMGIP